MFQSSMITRELALNLAKVIFMLKHSVKLRRYLLCGCVAACHGMACVACCAECDWSHSAQHATCHTKEVNLQMLPAKQRKQRLHY